MSDEKNGGTAWQHIEAAEIEFLRNLADKGGLADPVPGMLRHCARLMERMARDLAVIAAERGNYATEAEGDAFAHGYCAGHDEALAANT